MWAGCCVEDGRISPLGCSSLLFSYKSTKKRVISHTDSLNLQIVWNADVRWQARLMFLCPARPDSRGIVLSGCDFAVRRYLKVAVIHQET